MYMRILFVFSLFVVMAFSQDGWGQVYRYTDKDGNTVFTDNSTKAAGQKDSSKISDGSMGTWLEPEEEGELCYYPKPVGITHGDTGGTARSYDYREMQSYHDCVQRGGKKMPNPKDAKDYVERGLHYAKLGDHRQAIRDYNKAIELDPYYTTAYAGRGVAYFWLTDYRQAIRDFDRAIQLKPNFAMVYMARATAYLAMGDSSQVIDNYRIAAKLGDKKAQDFLRSLEESSTSPKPNKGISW